MPYRLWTCRYCVQPRPLSIMYMKTMQLVYLAWLLITVTFYIYCTVYKFIVMKKGGWSYFFHYKKSYTGVFWELGKCFAILKLYAHFNNPGKDGKECTLYVLLKWLQFFLNQAKLFEYWKLSELPWLLCFGYRISFVLVRLCLYKWVHWWNTPEQIQVKICHNNAMCVSNLGYSYGMRYGRILF